MRSRPHAYLGRSGRPLSEIYASDHADSRRGGRFRWLLSTCLAATVGVLAILVAIAGFMDTEGDEGGLFANLGQRLRQGPLALPLTAVRPGGLRWALPKTDKMVIPSGATALKTYHPDRVKQRKGKREYTVYKYYVRLAARLGPVSKNDGRSVPAFDPVKFYADTGPLGGDDPQERHHDADATAKDLDGILPNEDGQELDAQEVLALVMRAQAADKAAAARGETLAGRAQGSDAAAPAPRTTVLQKTVLESEEDNGPVVPAAHSKADRLQDNSLYASFYHAAAKQKVPHDLIMQVMRIHAYGTDFSVRVRAGDAVELFFDMKGEGQGIGGELGDLLATFITAGGKTNKFYRFRTPDGAVDFYDADGSTARKFLMRQPVRGLDVRLTSRFGMRKHPMLPMRRMHRGVDWACAAGTPIMAAGSGTVEFVGYKGESGNFVRLRHANGYKTGYAHMSGFAAGLAEGTRVRQGQIIGYVGSTGMSTAPHLHFEVHVKNRLAEGYAPVDPIGIPVPNDRQLAGKDLADFNRERARIDELMRRPPVRSANLSP
jgi:murein DD-endopeptidase MepM/ murein hydrolase activator NlpD